MNALAIALLSGVASSVATVIVERILERRARLVVYYGHVAAFTVRPTDQPAFGVNTHSVIVQNNGKEAARNVTLAHFTLPLNVSIFPEVSHAVVRHEHGGDIVFDSVVPGQQITVSYLYFPPVVANQVNGHVRYDKGLAKAVPVVLQQQYPRRVQMVVRALTLSGAAIWAYLAIRGALWALTISG